MKGKDLCRRKLFPLPIECYLPGHGASNGKPPPQQPGLSKQVTHGGVTYTLDVELSSDRCLMYKGKTLYGKNLPVEAFTSDNDGERKRGVDIPHEVRDRFREIVTNAVTRHSAFRILEDYRIPLNAQ